MTTDPDGTVHVELRDRSPTGRSEATDRACRPGRLRDGGAANSCGKSDTVLSCTAELGTCIGDPMPGDMTAAGTCSNDALVVCDVDADCTKVSGALSKDPTACVAGGGTAGSGSVCTGCVVP